ncbi:MAG: type III PLP-dependent enzyme [Spirochaetia bacterium]|nr:type III PLP-dependent enzyme [Spirochaetota bacterium]MCX8095993.1 type III PLP-dependent enzyme [Spirochaetota bacterium]MDW8112510.1 type III PLP-dependent enzyme [Spirochaetia bacterium]
MRRIRKDAKTEIFSEKVFTKVRRLVPRLIEEHKTPFLLMDSYTIKRKYYELVKFFPSFKVYYAVKANDASEVLEVLAGVGSNFEVSSVSEVVKLIELGVGGNRMITSNPVKPPEFIEVCRQVGINYLCVDSKEEIDKIKYLFPNANVYVRLEIDNPESSWPLSGKFGVLEDEIEDIISYAVRRKINLVGLTFHAGSQNNSVNSIKNAIFASKRVFDIARKYGVEMTLLNIGGGFPIDYTSTSVSISEFSKVVYEALNVFDNYDKLILQMEPGRRIVGEAGIIVSRVVGKACRTKENWLYLDVGVFNGLMETLGGIKYLFKTNSRRREKIWNIGGPSCDSMDVIVKSISLPEPDVGDIVCILSAGAYTTVYSAPFNGYKVPHVVLI